MERKFKEGDRVVTNNLCIIGEGKKGTILGYYTHPIMIGEMVCVEFDDIVPLGTNCKLGDFKGGKDNQCLWISEKSLDLAKKDKETTGVKIQMPPFEKDFVSSISKLFDKKEEKKPLKIHIDITIE